MIYKYQRRAAAFILAAAFLSGSSCFADVRVALSQDPGVNNAPALQKAVDEVSASGGGRVVVPAGRYVLGTLYLRSGVDLHLEEGAVLCGSLNVPGDYSDKAFICADGAERVTVSGRGIIDGRSDSEYYRVRFADGTFHNNDGLRPFGILFKDCRKVKVCGITLRNAGFWALRLFRCDGVDIRGITITSLHCINNDGIDVDARNVRISGCTIRTDDDGICLKSDDRDFPVENIRVRNCSIASNCNPIKFGTASYCAFRNVRFRDCSIHSTGEAHVWDWSERYIGIGPYEPLGLSGITVQSADGAAVEDIHFRNITMEGIMTPVFLFIGSRRNVTPGSMKDITFRNIKATARGVIPSMICGHRKSRIQNVMLKNFRVSADGYRGQVPDCLRENETGYPENRMFGKTNPAGALFIRHADGIKVRNLRVSHRSEDVREPVVVVDATDVSVR